MGAEEGAGFAGPDVSAPTTRVIKQHIRTIKAILASGVRMLSPSLCSGTSIPDNVLQRSVCVFFSKFINAEIVPIIGLNNINGLSINGGWCEMDFT
jgi:hypothetical protein